MKIVRDMSRLRWKVAGFAPFAWRFGNQVADISKARDADIPALPAPVPGSVQQALLNAGIIRDWTQENKKREQTWR